MRILLASLSAVLTTFDVIHSAQVDTGSGSASGILWNDVKPDHIFWDPYHSAVTIIDWGNGRFLEEGGVTRDMRHTAAGDRRQFLDEMGRFLAQASPELYARLNWPGTGHIYEDVNPLIGGLKDRLDSALAQSDRQLQEARSQEADLLQPSLDTGLDLSTLAAVHQRIVALGEIPDFPAALRLVSRSAANLAAAGDMGGVTGPECMGGWSARRASRISTPDDPPGANIHTPTRSGLHRPGAGRSASGLGGLEGSALAYAGGASERAGTGLVE